MSEQETYHSTSETLRVVAAALTAVGARPDPADVADEIADLQQHWRSTVAVVDGITPLLALVGANLETDLAHAGRASFQVERDDERGFVQVATINNRTMTARIYRVWKLPGDLFPLQGSAPDTIIHPRQIGEALASAPAATASSAGPAPPVKTGPRHRAADPPGPVGAATGSAATGSAAAGSDAAEPDAAGGHDGPARSSTTWVTVLAVVAILLILLALIWADFGA